MVKSLVTCPRCRTRFQLQPATRAGRPAGRIQAGSLADKVLQHLHANPGAELTAQEISANFTDGKTEARNVAGRLDAALRAGYLTSVVTGRGRRVFKLGTGAN